jgi:hypothetical protein
MRNLIAAIAGIIALLDVSPYLIDVVRGKTKPNIVSWFTWSLLLIIGTAAAFSDHQDKSALLTLGDGIGTTLVLVLGIKYGIAKFSWFDGICQICALIGLVLWLVFNSPTIAVIAVIAIDFIACLPTAKHSWQSPEEETWEAFALTVFASTLTLLSLTHYSVVSLGYPIFLLLVNLAFVVVVLYRRKKLGLKLSRTVKA